MQTYIQKIKNKISLPALKISIENRNQKEASPRICRNASYTVEAAVILPVFTAFMVVLLFFFRVLQVQQEVGNALIDAGRELSVLAYEEENGQSFANSATAKLLFMKNLGQNSAANRFISGGEGGISLVRSEFSGDYIRLRADYHMKIPTGLLGKHEIVLTQKAVCRKWIGNSIEGGQEEIVYITPTGTVYHKNKNCTYLKPSIQEISSSEINVKRNESGEKYRSCQRCIGTEKVRATLYITQFGNRYHNRIDCSELKRTVIAVPISEVNGRHACSKCGKETS